MLKKITEMYNNLKNSIKLMLERIILISKSNKEIFEKLNEIESKIDLIILKQNDTPAPTTPYYPVPPILKQDQFWWSTPPIYSTADCSGADAGAHTES